MVSPRRTGLPPLRSRLQRVVEADLMRVTVRGCPDLLKSLSSQTLWPRVVRLPVADGSRGLTARRLRQLDVARVGVGEMGPRARGCPTGVIVEMFPPDSPRFLPPPTLPATPNPTSVIVTAATHSSVVEGAVFGGICPAPHPSPLHWAGTRSALCLALLTTITVAGPPWPAALGILRLGPGRRPRHLLPASPLPRHAMTRNERTPTQPRPTGVGYTGVSAGAPCHTHENGTTDGLIGDNVVSPNGA